MEVIVNKSWLSSKWLWVPVVVATLVLSLSAGDEITVSVIDRGPGIKPGDEERVFDKFHRGSHEGAVGGAGLGLTICRAIVEAHGGRIWTENRLVGGAMFCFTLPLGGTPPTVEAETDAAA